MTAGILVIAGSAAPEARTQLERLAEAGALVLTLTREAVLTQDETLLMALRSAAGAALKQGRHVIVRSENWPGAAEVTRRLAAKRYIPAEEVERRVRTMLARVAEGVVKAAATRRLVAVGTEVGHALCDQLGITERQLVGEAAPGLVVWQAVVASDPVFLVLQPGSKGAPETLRQAVAALAGL